MKSPSKMLLVAAGVVLCAVVAAIAGAGNTAGPGVGVHNGVVTACIEPPTKGNRATSGDLNMSRLACAIKGARKISWNIRGPRGPAGAAGSGAQGPAGP